MTETEPPKQPDDKNVQFLMTQLVVLTVIIVGLLILVWAYPRIRLPFRTQAQVVVPTARPSLTPSPTPTVTITSTPTRTLRYTLTPTVSLTPSPTPVLLDTATPLGPPTLTPAVPLKDDKLYSLIEWTADEADYAIRLMEDYPNTLTTVARQDDNSGYWAAFDYAVVALKEALLRFPDAAQVESWEWDLALNLARVGEAEAGDRFAELIVRALNRGETTIDDLHNWFGSKNLGLDVYAIELTPPTGYNGSYLLQIEGAGSAFIWLLEKSGVYEAYPLVSDFDYVNQVPSRALLSDLNGDGKEEIIIYRADQKGVYELNPPQVFNLMSVPAAELQFLPADQNFNFGIEFVNRWSIENQEDGSVDLIFEGQTFPACPVTVKLRFKWNGEVFERQESRYEVKPNPNTLILCQAIVDHASMSWGPQAAVSLMEAILPQWPPTLTETGVAIPPEEGANMLDEWRFRLGMYHALIGDQAKAYDYLNKVGNEPSTSNSPWYAPAQAFINNYEKQEDIYLACVAAPGCRPADALTFLSGKLPVDARLNPYQQLALWGVVPVSSGYFDFDGDDSSERWFTIRHRPLEKLEFWIVADTPAGPRLVKVGNVDTNLPSVEYLDEEGFPPVVQVENVPFQMLRAPGSYDPFLVLLTPENVIVTRLQHDLALAEKGLLSGDNPEELQTLLEILPESLCPKSVNCDRFYYFLGLANELSGDERGAVSAYLQLWRNFIRSPFTTIARLKLMGETQSLYPLATPTPILTETPTGGYPYPAPEPTQPYPYPYPYPPYPPYPYP